MSNNAKNIKSVTTQNNNVNAVQTVEEIQEQMRQLAARLAEGGNFNALAEVEASVKTTLDTSREARIAGLDNLIAPLKFQIESINQQLLPLVAERNKLNHTVSEKKQRNSSTCTECGVGRHTDMSTCNTYAVACERKVAEIKDEKAKAYYQSRADMVRKNQTAKKAA